ncbi:hypothetical protein BCF11_0381 [Collimonas sp. PA-H2]|uniref:hypothetical protein n=1 Tax=Collimonas sp. PA-H2 TaxID=1881062 RepID=UPI000C001FDF|nr:hypothetical protein [Collimonas sp. PA-H2]PFH08030.1 hypothetical protein BCF11_0381 [Collimonas sp. PA-H2]
MKVNTSQPTLVDATAHREASDSQPSSPAVSSTSNNSADHPHATPMLGGGTRGFLLKQKGQPESMDHVTKFTGVATGELDVNNVEGKRSKEGNLFLSRRGSLYAGPEQFSQANAIRNGALKFSEGRSAFVDGKELRRVQYAVNCGVGGSEAGNILQKKINDNGGSSDEIVRVRANERFSTAPMKDNFECLIEGLTEDLEDVVTKEDKTKSWDDFKEAVGQELAKCPSNTTLPAILTAAEPPEKLEELMSELNDLVDQLHGVVQQNVERYVQGQDRTEGRAALPSDCGEASHLIVGQPTAGNDTFKTEKATPENSVAPRPGDIFKLETDNQSAEFAVHFGAVIMKDKDVVATLENTATKASEGFSKAPYDHGAKFNLYGAGEDEGFMKKYEKDFQERNTNI